MGQRPFDSRRNVSAWRIREKYMQIQVQFYGFLHSLVNTHSVKLEISSDTTIYDIVKKLIKKYPVLENKLSRIAFSIGDEIVSRDTILQENDELGLLPPFCGG